uniref:Leucine-rich repeat-containing N-terminal plant-type domain-containing protein n=1 Tax=Solanum lycopersicum TaxID=4081 RepID=A0A3Q7H5R4_SOLLC
MNPNHLCRRDESLVLQNLKLKLSIDDSASTDCESNGYFPYPKTLSWNRTTDCCTWDGVTCDKVTGRITHLDLSCSQLHGTIDSNSTLFQLSHLQNLNLAYNDFSPSQISSKFGWFPSLTHLNLSRSGFSGTVPLQVSYLSKLISLDLSAGCYFSGIIPPTIGDLTELTNLQLFSNNFNGQLPSTILNLVQLVEFDISSNNLTGNIPDIFGNFTKLKSLSLSYNLFTGLFPSSVTNLTELESLDLSNCSITVSYLNLSSNFLTAIDLLHNFESLYYLDIGSNLIQGELPAPPPLLFLFIASNNNFTGKLPNSPLCKMSSLVILDLSNNSLSGVIPKCLVNMSTSLSVLDLHNNNFSGTIPNNFGKGSSLRSLNLRKNKLEGVLPRKLTNCRGLEVVDLGENLLNDTFPKWLGSLPRLQVLSLRSNKLHGPITITRNQVLFSKLKILDLSYNDFTGNLSERFFNNLKSMIIEDQTGTPLTYIGEVRYHDSLTLSIKGQQIELVRILSIFTTIDFSNNKFKGDVPKSIGNLGSLRGLNLSHNSLIGPIPQSFGNLSVLESLDLSWNQLSGNVPQEVASLKSLAVMNLSQNRLMGRIPRGPQLDTFENDSYSGNGGLCGFPLSRNCGDNEMPHSTVPDIEDEEDSGFMDWRAAIIGCGCGSVFGLFIVYIIFLTGRPKWFVNIVNQHINRILLKIEAKRRIEAKKRRRHKRRRMKF